MKNTIDNDGTSPFVVKTAKALMIVALIDMLAIITPVRLIFTLKFYGQFQPYTTRYMSHDWPGDKSP